MHKNRYIEDIKFELKTFQFALYMPKFSFREYLQFWKGSSKISKGHEDKKRKRERKGVPSILKGLLSSFKEKWSSQKKREQERGREGKEGGRGEGRWAWAACEKRKNKGQRFGQSKKYNSGIGQPIIILICGQFEVHFGQFTRLNGLGNLAILHWQCGVGDLGMWTRQWRIDNWATCTLQSGLGKLVKINLTK
jgi:hypothetical protein